MLPARLQRPALSRPSLRTAAMFATASAARFPLSAASPRSFSSSSFTHRHTPPLLLRTLRRCTTAQHPSTLAVLSGRSFSTTVSTTPVHSSAPPSAPLAAPPATPPITTAPPTPPTDPYALPLDLSTPATATLPTSPAPAELLIDSPLTHAPLHSYTLSEAWQTASQLAFAPTNDHYWPVQAVQCLLDFIHLSTGLPWWLTIVVATFGVRGALLPLAIHQYRNGARMTLMRPEMMAMTERFKAKMTSAEGVTMQDRQQHRSDIQAMMAKYQCNPLYSLASPIVLAPVFLSFFAALQSMHSLHSTFAAGGVGHVLDLSAADPYLILPVLNALTMLIPMEFIPDPNGMPAEQRQRMKTIFRIIAIVFIFLGRSFPAGLFVYWIASNCFTILQQLLLRNVRVRRGLGIPDTSSVDRTGLTLPAWMGMGSASKAGGAGGAGGGVGAGSGVATASTVKEAIVLRNEKVGSVSRAPPQQAGEVFASKAAAKKNAKR